MIVGLIPGVFSWPSEDFGDHLGGLMKLMLWEVDLYN